MTIDNWIGIGVITATFGGPVVSAWIVRGTTEPKTHQDTWLTRVLSSPWIVPPFVVLSNLWHLIIDYRQYTAASITKGFVLRISFDVAGIVWGGVCVLVWLTWKMLSAEMDLTGRMIRVLERHAEYLDRHLALHEKVFGALDSYGQRLDSVADRTLEQTTGALLDIDKGILNILQTMSQQLPKSKRKK